MKKPFKDVHRSFQDVASNPICRTNRTKEYAMKATSPRMATTSNTLHPNAEAFEVSDSGRAKDFGWSLDFPASLHPTVHVLRDPGKNGFSLRTHTTVA